MWQARPLCICLICDFCSSDREFALGLLHTPPHDGRTCPLLTVPTAKPVVDFHHQVSVHSGQTTKPRRRIALRRGSFMLKNGKNLDFKRFLGIEKVHRNSIKITADLWQKT